MKSFKPQRLANALPAGFSILILIFALHLGWVTFHLPFVPGLLASTLLLVVFLAATGSGRRLLNLFRLDSLSELEKTVIGATLGLGLLSQGVFLLGILGWLKPWAVSFGLGVLLVLGYMETRDCARSLNANVRRWFNEEPLFMAAIAAALAVLFWMTWVPPHQYDALVYHLPLAAAYAREGRIFPVAHLLFTHFPQNGEMLYALALMLGSDLLAHMFMWLGTFLSLCWILVMGGRGVSLSEALLACLLLVTHTAVMLLTPVAYVECLVMLWVSAAVLSFLRWKEQSESAGARAWLVLSGIFSGLGLGTKYYAGITPALLGLYLLIRATRSKAARKDFFVFFVAAAGLGAPWLIKNYCTVGNPVFPFLYQLMPPRGVDWGAQSAARYFGFLTEYGHHCGHFFRELLSFPYLAAMGSTLFGGGADVLGDLGWGLIFILLPVSAWAAWRHRTLRWVLAYCAAHWAIWYGAGVVLRFLVALVPLLSLLTAHGILQLRQRLGPWGKRCLACGIAGLLALNTGFFLYVHAVVRSLDVLVGLDTRSRFLERHLDYYPCAQFAQEQLPPNDKILVVGEQRGYYIIQPQVTTTPMAPNPFVLMANQAQDTLDLAHRLKEQGFRHLLGVARESRRLAGYGVFAFTPEGFERWNALEKTGQIRLEFETPGRCQLYRFQ